MSLRLITVSGLFGALASAVCAAPPNVLFIAVDDLRPLLGAYGHTEVHSPNIDRLAARGVTYLNAACQFPVCGPSRASLLTGRRPETTGILDLKTRMRDVHPDTLTLPQHFKNHGYTTVGMGKIFDPRCVDSRQQGDAPSWSIPYDENPASDVVPVEEDRAVTGAFDAPDEAFPDGRIGRRAVERLRELAGAKAPFFLAVGFRKPHLPFVAPQRFWDLYDPAKIRLAEFQAEAEGNSGYGYWNSNEIRGYEGVPADGAFPDALQVRLIHGYMACVSWVDELIGRLLGELDALGLRENTIIVLWGDHGFHLGEHGMWGKHTPFEEAIRSPLILVDPRTGRGHRTIAPVEFTDIFPTLCELAGLPRPDGLEGVSLVPTLTSETAFPRQAAIGIYRSKGALGYSVRTPRYRYIEWIAQGSAKVVGRDLFDFEIDPLGRRNWAADPDHAPALEELTRLLHADATGWKLLQRSLVQQ
jgi:arylsulfatase A-like enzyme